MTKIKDFYGTAKQAAEKVWTGTKLGARDSQTKLIRSGHAWRR
jgi:hypothetical protein